MPIFEYICQDCGAAFEAIVANESTEVSCRNCHGRQLKKQLSTFAVSSTGNANPEAAPSPCDSCGAARQGMCQMMN